MIKPILFNTEMVRAILDNRKTVTRQVIHMPAIVAATVAKTADRVRLKNGAAHFDWSWGEAFAGFDVKLPCHPGDILYVRETFFEHRGHFYYKADGKHDALAELGIVFKWHPPLHMPREAARIFLRVTGVRVERLREITWADACKEGCERPMQFDKLWDSTIKPTDRALYSWEANPWVWVIEFERVSREAEVPLAAWRAVGKALKEGAAW